MPCTRFTFSESTEPFTFQEDRGFTELLEKWGLRGAHSSWLLQRYHYDVVSETEGQSVSGSKASEATSSARASVSPSVLRFHEGLASEFLSALIVTPAVLRAVEQARTRSGGGDGEAVVGTSLEATGIVRVEYDTLSCRWNSLDPLDRLVDAGVVRCATFRAPHPSAKDSSYSPSYQQKGTNELTEEEQEKEEEEGGALSQMPSMPTRKVAERVLPNDIVISDEVRALFLEANAHRRGGTADKGNDYWRCGGELGEEVSSGDIEGSDGDADDDDVMAGLYADEGSGGLSRTALRAVFSPSERKEWVYHIVWRLVAGGGYMNQYEDDFAVYKDAARTFLRSVTTSVRVKRLEAESYVTTSAASATEKTTGDAIEGGVQSRKETMRHGENSNRYLFVPEIASFVFQVNKVTHDGHVLPEDWLFPRSDVVEPSNLNYCYVVVNPLQQQAVLWYHCI